MCFVAVPIHSNNSKKNSFDFSQSISDQLFQISYKLIS